MLSKDKTEIKTDFADVHQAVEEIAKTVTDTSKELDSKIAQSLDDFKKLQTDVDELNSQFAALKNQLETTEPEGQRRKPATGGDSSIKTDC